MNPFEEMTDEQLVEGLVQSKKQLEAYLSSHMVNTPQSGMVKVSRGHTSNVLLTTLKLQQVVKTIEDEIRSREGEPSGLSARFEMKMAPAQKQWVLENGGAAKVRELIDQVRNSASP